MNYSCLYLAEIQSVQNCCKFATICDQKGYTRVGRVADRENCAWASAIFERSGSIQVKKKATLTVSEGSTILRGLAELRLIDRRRQTGLKSNALRQG